MKYKQAWKCHKCPESNEEKGCPAWTELIEMNIETGQERVTKECLFQMMPRLMVEVIKASNRPAAELSAMRREVVNQVQKLARTAAYSLPVGAQVDALFKAQKIQKAKK